MSLRHGSRRVWLTGVAATIAAMLACEEAPLALDQATYRVTAEVATEGAGFPASYTIRLRGPYEERSVGCDGAETQGFGTLFRDVAVPPGATAPFTLSTGFDNLGRGCYSLRMFELPTNCVEERGPLPVEASALVSNEDVSVLLRVTCSATPATVDAIELNPSTAQLIVGNQVGLVATVLDQDANPMANEPVDWHSNDEAIAGVVGSGVDQMGQTATVTGFLAGTANIIASVLTPTGEVSDTTVVTVVGPPDEVIYTNMADAGQWIQIERGATGGATSPGATHPQAGGNGDDADYRRIEHVFPDAGSVNYFHGFTGETYDPSTQGAITSLSFSDYRQQFEPATGSVGARFALMQGGVIYRLENGEAFGPSLGHAGWVRFEANDVTEADFGASGPDLTATGGPITFGFLRTNTRLTPSPLTIVHGTDDFRVEIRR